nr:putative ribonuclease H-like domain-containing protein [Tanacetum cinerariifolium]
LTATRPDIMFAVCAATRHQVTPKTSNLLTVKRIFKYLTAYPKLGLWYPRDSPLDLEAFSNSDYAGANGDRKSTTVGSKYVAAASCCGQGNIVHLWFLFTSAGGVTFCWLFPIPAGVLVSAGHILFLLTVYFSCWGENGMKLIGGNLEMGRCKKLIMTFSLYMILASAVGLDSVGGLAFAVGLDSAGGVDSTGGLPSAGISVAAGPTVPAKPSSLIRDPSKGKVVATPSLPVSALTAKELADQQAAILEVERQELLEQELKQSIDAEQVYLDSLLAQRIVYDKIRRAVDLATAKDHHQHLKRSGETLESLELKKLKSSHSTTQPAELQETTSVSAGVTIVADDPILAVTFVFAASSIPIVTLIATGVSTTAGASGSASEAYVPIIELLDSSPKDTSLPLDLKTEEQEVTLRKSSRKKSIARRRTLPSAYKPKSDALSFDKDDPKAEFKRYLRQAFDDDEPAEPVSLALVSDITTWEIIPLSLLSLDLVRFMSLQEQMELSRERATGIGLGLWMDLSILITFREERDVFIIWDDQDRWQIQSWRFYALPAIHVLETEAGDTMYISWFHFPEFHREYSTFF